ncbi:MAG: nucleotide pyrophosphatase/phosphodiesterase family protein [Acidobacteriota bacterium]
MALLVCAAGCSRPGQGKGLQPTVILISLDGFRWDYQSMTETPHLDRLADSGVRAQGLIPVFPSKTFPSHYSIVTGLHPENHGIVANNMYDPRWDVEFNLRLREVQAQGRWWEGEPIWVTAIKAGKKAACMFWPGSEVAIQGIRPTYWKEFDSEFPYEKRIEQLLAWLDLPAEQRPVFISCYFSLTDTQGHKFGPGSEPLLEAVRQVDALMGLLIEGLEERKLFSQVHLMIVSDHGMADAGSDRVLYIDDYLDLDRLRVVDLNPVAQLLPQPDYLEEAFEALQGVPHLTVYRKEEMPARLHLSKHPRIPPLIALAEEGWTLARRGRPRNRPFPRGNHGYDNALQSMQGLFIASGPGLKEGLFAAPVSALHIYPLMCHILGLQPAPNDGDLEAVRSYLKADGSGP